MIRIFSFLASKWFFWVIYSPSHKTIKYFTDQVTSSNPPYFRSVVKINDINCGVGEGPNKRSAEQLAAKEALKKIKEI